MSQPTNAAASGAIKVEPQATLSGIRERLIERMWRGLFVIALIGVPLSLARVGVTGWLPLYAAHLVIGLVVVTVFCLRKRLSYRVLVGFILALFWAVGIAGALSLGLLGAGLWWLSMSTLLISVLISMRWGIISVAGVVLAVLFVAAGFVGGGLELGFDANAYVRQPISWLVLLIGTTLMPLIVFSAFAEFQRATEGLLDAIRAQSLLITEKNTELKRANEALQDFTYIVSHDLVEPMRGVNSLSTILLEEKSAALDEEGRQYLEMIQQNSAHLQQMVKDLLHVSRLEHGRIEPAPVDINTIVDNVLMSLSELIRERRAEVRRAQDFPRVSGDRVRLAEVFYNLTANALKYNDKEQPWVEIGWEANGDRPRFFVADNGIGILPGHHDKIFKMFTRDHERGRFGDGSGVGLSLVRKIIELHQGQIAVESEPGQGAKFIFSLGL